MIIFRSITFCKKEKLVHNQANQTPDHKKNKVELNQMIFFSKWDKDWIFKRF